jgi:integrase/recombinase XerD
VTRLRKMMLEELQRRNYSAITTRNYLRVVTEFAKYFGKSPDKLGPNELRTYQAYLLTERKLTPGTVVNRVAALRFFSSRHSSAISFASSYRTPGTGVGSRRC